MKRATAKPDLARRARQIALLNAGVKPARIAERMGVSPSMVSAVISGRKRSERIEKAIAAATNIPRSTLWLPN